MSNDGRAPGRIHVAHCVHGLGLGGAQKVIATIVRESDPAAFQHFVYSCDDGVHGAEVAQAGATVRIIARRLPRFDPTWVAALASAMRSDAIDVVHTHLFGDSLHGYLASLVAGRPPVVMTLHNGIDGMTSLQRGGYRWLLARCARAVACSGSVERSFASFGGGAFPPLQVISNGIAFPSQAEAKPGEAAALRAELGAREGELVLATIGRLVPQKGHRFLFAALAKLGREHGVAARLVVLGDGPIRDELETQARADGIAECVLFAGIRLDVLRLLPAIDVVVFSSLYEGLPVALLEGMATGRCIVSTSCPGIVEAARDEREALIVPIGDADGLCEALRRVATEPGLAARLGAAAKQRFAGEFTAAQMTRRYEALYRDVLGRA